MVIDEKVMKELVEDGFGPVTFAKKGKDYSARIGEQDVTVTIRGHVFAAAATTKVAWPTNEDPDFDVDGRVAEMVREVSDEMAGVVDVSADNSSSALKATVYRDTRTAGPEDAAAAVKGAATALRRASAAVDRLRQLLEAQDELSRAVRANPMPEPREPDHTPARTPPAPEKPAQPPTTASSWKAVGNTGGEDAADWVFVELAVDLYDPAGAGRVVGKAQAGRWFLLKQERDGWALIEDPDGRVEGWIDAAAVRRRT